MKQRILVAVVGVPLLLLLFIAAPAWATLALVCLVSAVGCYELLRAVGGAAWKSCAFLVAFAAATPAVLGTGVSGLRTGAWVLLAVVLTFLTGVLCYGRPGRQISFAAMMAGLFGALAIPMAFTGLYFLRNMENGRALVLLPLCCAFGSDTLALFAGMLFGRHKLAPHVSPKKTVEGSLGGFLGSILLVWLLYGIAGLFCDLQLSMGKIVLLGLLGSFMGQLGDLSFSVIKREFGVKDYGNLLPGHGGVLDRFDSVAFVTPVVWLAVSLFG